MSFISTAAQLIVSILLTLIPSMILKQQKMNITIGFCFFSLFATIKVGGLILAVPVLAFMCIFFLWLHFAVTKQSKAYLLTTLIVVSLWFLSQLLHLPLRFHLNQPTVKIAANIAGLLLAGALTSGTIEFMIYAKSTVNDRDLLNNLRK